MKKLNKLTAVLLSLTLCLGMVAPAFAASFDDLQDAINGVVAEPDAPAADVPQNGTQVKDEAEGTFGYGWNGNESSEGKGWDIWAKDTADGGRDVELHGNVTQGEGGKDDASTIIVDSDDGKVNIGLNDHNITGNGKDTVIEVQQGGDLTITGGEGETGNTISNNPSNTETPAEGANGIDVEGKLELDGVTIKDTDTAVNVEEGGEAQIEDSTITGNNTGVAFETDRSVTFVEDQNVVNGNTTNISGTGKVKFELDGTIYKVDAKTAETLLKPDSIDSYGTDWILAKNGDGAYTVVYTGPGSGSQKQMTKKLVTDTLQAAGAGGKAISGFVVSGDVTSIGADAFRNCTWLEEVQLKGNITSIGSNAFNGCKNLEEVVFSENSQCTRIDQGAFKSCKGLRSFTIPKSVTTIGYRVFSNCSKLYDVTMPATVTELSDKAFEFSDVQRVWIYPEDEAERTQAEQTVVPKLTGVRDVYVVGAGEAKKYGYYDTVDLGNLDKDCFKPNGYYNADVDVSSISSLTITNRDGKTTTVELGGTKEISLGRYEHSIPGDRDGAQITITEANQDKWSFDGGGVLISMSGHYYYGPSDKLKWRDKGIYVSGESAVTAPDGSNISLDSEESTILDGRLSTNGDITYTLGEINIEIGGKNATDKTVVDTGAGTVTVPGKGTVKVGDGSTAYPSGAVMKDGVITSKGDVGIGDGRADINATSTEASITVDPITGDITLPDRGRVEYADANQVNITVVPSEGNDITVRPNGTIDAVPAGSTVTVDGVEYDFSLGGSIIVNEDGTVSVRPTRPARDDFTANGPETETEIEDEAVPLANGPVTRAQFIDYLWRHEGSPEAGAPTFTDVPADHEYVLALGWAQANGIAVADSEGNFQPDELVTVAAVREFLGSFTSVFGTNAVAADALTTLTGEDGEAVLNCDQVLAEFFGEEYILPEDLDILEPDIAA